MAEIWLWCRTGAAAARDFLRPVWVQLVVAGALLAAVALGGVEEATHPRGTAFDRLADSVLPDQWSQPFWHHTASLGGPWLVSLGVLVSAVSLVRRNRRLALTCILAPSVAVVLCEGVIKPLVGVRHGGVYSYPSGHVTAAVAMLLDVVVATPRQRRWISVSIGAGAAALVMLAVVADRQHDASDAVAALLLAPAVLMLVASLNRPTRKTSSRAD